MNQRPRYPASLLRPVGSARASMAAIQVVLHLLRSMQVDLDLFRSMQVDLDLFRGPTAEEAELAIEPGSPGAVRLVRATPATSWGHWLSSADFEAETQISTQVTQARD